MIKTNRNKLLWIIAIAFIALNQLWVISNSTYLSPSMFGKVLMISADIIAGIIIPVISALLLSTILSFIPNGTLTYKQRFRNVLPIALILIELLILVFVYRKFL